MDKKGARLYDSNDVQYIDLSSEEEDELEDYVEDTGSHMLGGQKGNNSIIS